MGTSTSRVGLYKPLSDGSELVNVAQDLNGNADKIDLAVGFQACTSSTRPATPYSGKAIFETNTSYRSYFSNGTSPASASWVEIPNSSATYSSAFQSSGNIGTSAQFTGTGSSAGQDIIRGLVSGDAQNRFTIDADGRQEWGGGATTRDTSLYRSGTATLQTDNNLNVVGNLTASGIGQRLYVRKTADETVTSSNVYQDDDQLLLPVVSGAAYTVEGYIVYQTVSAAGINLKLTGPTGTGLWTFFAVHVSAGSTDAGAIRTAPGINGTGNAYLGGAGTNMSALLRGTFLPSASGNLQLAWSQNASNGTGTIVRANSWLELIRTA